LSKAYSSSPDAHIMSDGKASLLANDSAASEVVPMGMPISPQSPPISAMAQPMQQPIAVAQPVHQPIPVAQPVQPMAFQPVVQPMVQPMQPAPTVIVMQPSSQAVQNAAPGRFSSDCCDCCANCAVCLTTMFCPFIGVGQLAQRYSLGRCSLIATVMFCLYCGALAMSAMSEEEDDDLTDEGLYSIGGFFSCAYFVGMIMILMSVRSKIRREHRIPPTSCGEGCDDFCCAFCCPHCTQCMLLRHTLDHTPGRPEYEMCSEEGCAKHDQPGSVGAHDYFQQPAAQQPVGQQPIAYAQPMR